MKFLLVYPSWPKLEHQTRFDLPPHGPAVMAAEIPEWVDVTFVDENVQEVPLRPDWDFVGISVMLTSQLPRAFAIADAFRGMGIDVLFGGISAMLHAEDVSEHCTSLFYGEVEGRLAQVFDDKKNGRLKPLYDYKDNHPAIELVGPARRSILDYSHYQHKGIRMADLFHASRGCRFNCLPCCTPYLGGRRFRPRPMDRVAEELAEIESDRLFVVDNSLAQDKQWEIDLFKTMIPFKKRWCCHPIQDDDEVLDLAAQAGAWYVYQAIVDTSEYIKNRVKRYKTYGIGVEGTIILGTDDQDEDYIKRFVDFLLEIELDLAEFTVLTPFWHTRIRAELEQQGRILTSDFSKYDAGTVVFQPKQMTPGKLQELYHYAWDTFYADEPQTYKMFKMFKRVAPPRDRRTQAGAARTGTDA
ncbi:MAG: radical SAM protein [Chitinivibrionales bacterium]|nr:radical SAM protein [Chitinivibrionales bacterium]